MQRPTRRSVSARLIIATLLFSSLITLAATSLQLYFDYARDIDLIHDRMRQIHDSHLKSIAASLWAFDNEQLQVQVEGIGNLPDLQRVAVIVDGAVFVETGRQESTNSIDRTFAVEWSYKGEQLRLGDLTVSANLDGIYTRLLDKILVILSSQAIKTFLVSSFIFLLFRHLVTRHLAAMASHVRALRLDELAKPLKLDRRQPTSGESTDELDQVVQAVNDMRNNLERSWAELKVEHDCRVEAERLASIGEFSAMIAHEIRNPLASIVNAAELLGRDQLKPAIRQETIALINSESHRLKHILDDFLRSARLRPSKLEENSVHDTIAKVCELVRLGMADHPHITLECECSGVIAPCLFDREQIEQVLWNLILNAMQAIPPNGGRVRVRAVPVDTGCRIEVADTGLGMTSSREEWGAASQPRPRRGMGLGLSIVQRILADHDSVLHIMSESGCGTEVSFNLNATGSDHAEDPHRR